MRLKRHLPRFELSHYLRKKTQPLNTPNWLQFPQKSLAAEIARGLKAAAPRLRLWAVRTAVGMEEKGNVAWDGGRGPGAKDLVPPTGGGRWLLVGVWW